MSDQPVTEVLLSVRGLTTRFRTERGTVLAEGILVSTICGSAPTGRFHDVLAEWGAQHAPLWTLLPQ